MRAAKTMQRGREHEKDNGSTLVLALMPQLQPHYPSIAPGSQLAQVHAVGSGQAELNQVYWPMIVFIAFMAEIPISSANATNADTHMLSPSLCS
jgi:hypothetical protein